MKIRLDFVTNSSSSSFIIFCKGIPEIDRKVLDDYPFIARYIKRLESMITDQSEVIHTQEELEKYIVDYYGWGDCKTLEKILADEDYVKDKYESWKSRIEEGYTIMIKTVENDDDSAISMLDTLNDGETFIIEGEY